MATTFLCLHGVRISASIKLKVKDVDFDNDPTSLLVGENHAVYLTKELSQILKGLASGKSSEDPVLGYGSNSEFYREFRLMARAAGLHNFDVSDISEMFKAAAGSDYPLLKQYDSAQPFAPEDVKTAWLKVLPCLAVRV